MASDTDSAKLGIAFALVCLAGLCAPLGASVVVFMRKSHTGLLAGSIALAAGVMVFVSLTEVLSDSMKELEHGGWKPAVRHTYTYMAFFGGVALCRVLDWFADSLMALIAKVSSRSRRHSTNSSDDLCAVHVAATEQELRTMREAADKDASSRVPTSPKHIHVPDLEEGSPKGDLIATGTESDMPETIGSAEPVLALIENAPPEDEHERVIAAAVEQLQDDDCGHLIRTSILVWLALSLHNIPEGLATIAGYMSSPHLGVTVAVAIAIHNIPEGIALGVPVFFATGSRWKAIGWAAASGLAEPLGALIGLALQLTGRLNPVAMGVIMACVAGVMTGIAFQELLPRALSFDPANKWTTPGVFVGMGVMAGSLILLGLWDTSM